MEILEAFDLMGTYRGAAALVGCDHHTVAEKVRRRDAGMAPGDTVERDRVIVPFLATAEDLVDRSEAQIRADVVHRKLVRLGYEGSERTTRREVAALKRAWRAGNRRVYRPWLVEPGRWVQWDWGHGPTVAGEQTYLWCAWLAWSRFRVVLATRDKTLPTVLACLDRTFRALGGVPTYALTDNEKTVTVEHVAGIAVRHPEVVAASTHYGVLVETCAVADPETKGGSEATVRIAKADLVPTDTNLLDEYGSFAELEAACAAFCARVNARPHHETRRPPQEMLAVEVEALHPVPAAPYMAAFGDTRSVRRDSTISFGGVRYSVPCRLIDETVRARVETDHVVIVHVDPTDGAVEVARHLKSTPGRPRICDEHYPPRPDGPGRTPKARNSAEDAFLQIGDGAHAWLVEAAASGASRVRTKMATAVTLAKLHSPHVVDRALGVAAVAGRFADGDLEAILAHQHTTTTETHAADETHSAQPGTRRWEGFGR